MYDTTPLAPFKGETKPFLHVGFDNKTLESLFDLHPSFETSLDLSDYVTGVSHHPAVGGGGGNGGCGVIASPHSVPDSAVVTSPVPSSPADLLTLSSAATSQHLAEIERQQPPTPIASSIGSGGVGGGNNSNNGISSSAHHHHHHQHHNSGAPHFLAQPPHTSPSPVVPSTPSPVSHHHHHHIPQQHHHHHQQHQQQQQQHQQQQQQQQQLQGGYHQPVLSPSLSVDEVSQALSDDSCVFMPEYEQLTSAGAGSLTGGTSVGGQWGTQQDPFYNPVKTENMGGLTSLTTCSLEASLPGFTSSSSSTTTTSSSSHHHPHHQHPHHHHAGSSSSTSTSNTAACKMEYESVMMDAGHYSRGAAGMGSSVSPSHSMRTLSESSTATTSTMPDSPGRGSGSRRESGSGSGLGKGGSKRRQVPKGSEEYKEKRARNNVAVRKSRAKAKEKQRMTESRVKELTDLNESLQKKVDVLTKELTVLRRLFVDVGATLPDDLSKLLGQQS